MDKNQQLARNAAWRIGQHVDQHLQRQTLATIERVIRELLDNLGKETDDSSNPSQGSTS